MRLDGGRRCGTSIGSFRLKLTVIFGFASDRVGAAAAGSDVIIAFMVAVLSQLKPAHPKNGPIA